MKFLPLAIVLSVSISTADEPDSQARGERIFQQTCIVCHQATGQGAPPVFPPLAQSDWIKANRERAIRALCEGLGGPIRVNGADYNNQMPVQPLDDRGVADVLTFVFSSWGNAEKTVRTDEVAKVRRTSKFPTFEALVRAHAFAPLPAAPSGMKLREVVQLSDFATRLAGPARDGSVYVLGQKGAIWKPGAECPRGPSGFRFALASVCAACGECGSDEFPKAISRSAEAQAMHRADVARMVVAAAGNRRGRNDHGSRHLRFSGDQ